MKLIEIIKIIGCYEETKRDVYKRQECVITISSVRKDTLPRSDVQIPEELKTRSEGLVKKSWQMCCE